MKYIKVTKVIILSILLTSLGCSSKLKPTSIKIQDAERHYYPIMAGEILTLNYEIENTGKEPLIISEIQTTCGCISTDKSRKVVPEGQKTTLNFEYDSSKNIGYVSHEILLYGNFDSTSIYRLFFDVTVVPDADYTKDYEILYNDIIKKDANNKKERNRRNKKSYYIDSKTKDR